jgi:hypothetical protein
MRTIIYISLIFIGLFITACSEKEVVGDIFEKCPCDSIGKFTEQGKILWQCYLGKSNIEIKPSGSKDTLEITRFYTSDTKWHVQEYILVADTSIVDAEYGFYCDYKPMGDSVELSFIRNEEVIRDKKGPFFKELIGSEIIINNDTLSSKSNSIRLPKEKFKGIIRFDKVMKGLYEGEEYIYRVPMQIEAENMIKYGNLLEQYKIINRLCKKNKAAVN